MDDQQDYAPPAIEELDTDQGPAETVPGFISNV
jgi:hypothetical protein